MLQAEQDKQLPPSKSYVLSLDPTRSNLEADLSQAGLKLGLVFPFWRVRGLSKFGSSLKEFFFLNLTVGYNPKTQLGVEIYQDFRELRESGLIMEEWKNENDSSLFRVGV